MHRAGVQASLDLGFGRCALRAGADALTVRVEAADAGSLRRVQAVIGADLDRFGRREGLTVAWEPR
ncbi:MAG TPA: DUF2218 domain-containing protein [Rugosimonospora sp.]|nr:DUF2218 domain-containing protein [Rugosimonospora sp.]